MEEEEEDDIYAPDDSTVHAHATHINVANPLAHKNEDEEEGEEVEEEESDSDIDIILERDPKTETAQPPRVNALKGPPGRTPSIDIGAARKGSPGIKIEAPGKETQSRPGASYPAVKASNVDMDAKPIYESTGKPITEIDMDADFPEDDKPWRRPGTDMTDYFNYGFDEFTWASYCLKQKELRKEVTDMQKQMDDMQNFMSIPGGMPPMPGMPGPAGGAQPGMPAMAGAGDMLPDMQQMMAQMMAQGIDPTQMDQAAFVQMMQAGGGGAGDPNQNFGGQVYGQQGQNQQQMGYGYQGGGGGGRNQGRGQGRRW